MTVQYARDLQTRIKELDLVDPTDRKPVQRQAAPPLDTLRGKRAGFLDNRKGGADALLERVREVLVEQHGVINAAYRVKWGYSFVATPELLDELARSCDFVVTAVGD